ncbi:MAG TPA: CDP-alcohol phosphatidyltransferase family protein [Chloroflexota bacterium]|nr:CDP-alcohol phosphatidyltransferase family protein [Chloroflexota bacterium]
MVGMSAQAWRAMTGELEQLEHVGADAPEPIVTTPNLITLSGYAAGLYWLAGGSPAWALWSLAADELDGESARALGQSTALGDALDSSVDMCMAALIGLKLGLWWLMPITLFIQVWQRQHGYKPTIGSARAILTLRALAKGG